MLNDVCYRRNLSSKQVLAHWESGWREIDKKNPLQRVKYHIDIYAFKQDVQSYQVKSNKHDGRYETSDGLRKIQ